jgi:ribonuclease P protein component
MDQPRLTFSPAHRLKLQRDFDRVYRSKLVKRMGPVRIHAALNDLPHNRLGMSVGRRVGNAAVRNRIRRLIRESFRLLQHDLPQGYDLVVVVLSHAPLPLAEYQQMLRRAMASLAQRNDPPSPPPSPPALGNA